MKKTKQQAAVAEEPAVETKKKSGRKSKAQVAEEEKKIQVLKEEAEHSNSIIAQVIRNEAQKIVERKADEAREAISRVRRGRPSDRVYRKFSSQELIAIFNGWFTLQYAFSIKNDEITTSGEQVETDFYICSQDCSQMDVNHRPPVNLAIQREFGNTVYGFAIIAPATAF